MQTYTKNIISAGRFFGIAKLLVQTVDRVRKALRDSFLGAFCVLKGWKALTCSAPAACKGISKTRVQNQTGSCSSFTGATPALSAPGQCPDGL